MIFDILFPIIVFLLIALVFYYFMIEIDNFKKDRINKHYDIKKVLPNRCLELDKVAYLNRHLSKNTKRSIKSKPSKKSRYKLIKKN